MTGFGKAECQCKNRKVVIEIKSLNSKQLDVNARLPNGYREKEIEIRNLISAKLQRGKVDFIITVENEGETTGFTINKALARKYYHELKELAEDFDQQSFNDYLPILIRMPEVMMSEKEEIKEDEWKELLATIKIAIDHLESFRLQEGKTLAEDFEKRINRINNLLAEVKPFEKVRVENLKNKFKKDLHDMMEGENIDSNRLEQELIYYIEKLDITEEKVRLQKHLEYFTETLNETESQGKKLIFISQEIGREINTMGSKASDANIQKIVVQMKDELEKIKEQMLNIL
jgi:uncharacterized protein (TIGR00255 family)